MIRRRTAGLEGEATTADRSLPGGSTCQPIRSLRHRVLTHLGNSRALANHIADRPLQPSRRLLCTFQVQAGEAVLEVTRHARGSGLDGWRGLRSADGPQLEF